MRLILAFFCAMTGSACAAVICVSTSTTANAIGVGGVPGILSIQPQYMGTFALAMLVAIAVPFVLTVAVGKKKGIDKDAEAAQAAAELEAAQRQLTRRLKPILLVKTNLKLTLTAKLSA